MGFGASAKELSNDPPISEVLKACKAEQATRFKGGSLLAYAKSLPGVTKPLGFFDPLGFCSEEDVTEGKIKFYREVELKHGRVGMLAALGIVVGENFHPLFGGNIDAPAYLAFQQTPLETFWPIVVVAIAIPEIYSVFTFEPVGATDSRGKPTPQGMTWSIRAEHEAGDLGFDPLGLKPTDPAELKEMQTKELNNGRLAMIAAAGMIVQELATKEKLFMLAVGGQETAATETAAPVFNGVEYAKSLPGVTGPLGFFDPLGFCSADDATEGKIKFYREVELKHGRVGMLAALGFVVGENFHPLFGGDIDVPAYLAFQQTPLQTFWPAVVLAIAIPEIFSVFSFKTPALFARKGEEGGMPWEIRSDFKSGDLGFDPLGLKPTDPAELKEMQTKELQNGRLGMIAAAGMIAQELASNQKLFMLSVSGQEAVDSEADATFSRRKLIAGFAATAPLVAAAIPAFAINFEKDGGNQDGKSTDAFGATGGQKTVANGGSLVGTKGAFQAGRSGGKIPEIRVAGTWNDAAHPGCTRKIAVNGSKAFISGADEDGKKWKVTGEVKGKSIIVDFTPKGGPADIEAKYVIGKGLVFPDGNVWSKA